MTPLLGGRNLRTVGFGIASPEPQTPKLQTLNPKAKTPETLNPKV